MSDEVLAKTREELCAAYTLLREALPLARLTLLRGGVSLREQEDFWSAYTQIQGFCDPDAEDLNSPSGFNSLIEDLTPDH